MQGGSDDADYTLLLSDVYLYVKMSILNEALYKSIKEKWRQGPAKIPMTRCYTDWRVIHDNSLVYECP